MATTTDSRAVLDLADRLANVYASCEGAADEIFAPDVLFDINVPSWRFQIVGPEAFFDWLREGSPQGYGVTLVRAVPTASGFVAEMDGRYAPDGEELTFRNLLLCEVVEGRISELVIYCTGDWDAETRARQAAEAPMVRS